jgi:hypothetical protein
VQLVVITKKLEGRRLGANAELAYLRGGLMSRR